MKTLNTTPYIRVSHIHAHPDNPRKDLGDLSELIESVKKNGILQDITVIPDYCLDSEPGAQEPPSSIYIEERGFYVLMGHRRLAAIRDAGNDDAIRCKVVYELSRAEQIGIMLEENVQRNDLTIPEQIESFQLMLDLGETVDSISAKTGFSKTTIYKRVKNADVADDIKEAGHQLTIADLDELAKVDTDAKKRILKRARNSNDIRIEVNQEIAAKERKEKQDYIIGEIKKRGALPFVGEVAEKHSWWQMDHVTAIPINDPRDEDMEDIEEGDYYQVPNSYTTAISINRLPDEQDDEEEEEDEEEKAERERREKNEEALNEINEALKSHIRTYLFGLTISRGEFKPDWEEITDILKSYDTALIRARDAAAVIYDKAAYMISREEMSMLFRDRKMTIDIMAALSLYQGLRGFTLYDGAPNEKGLDYWYSYMEMLEHGGYPAPDIKDLGDFEIPEGETLEDIILGNSELYNKEGQR